MLSGVFPADVTKQVQVVLIHPVGVEEDMNRTEADTVILRETVDFRDDEASAFLGDIKKAFDKNSELPNLLFNPFFKKAIKDCQRSWRKASIFSPVPCHPRFPLSLLASSRWYWNTGVHMP